MKKLKQAFLYVWRLWYVKYVVVCVVGVLIVGFLDNDSVWAHMKYQQRISELKEEIAHYESINAQNQAQIILLRESPKAIEKIARERYFMKSDDEDIFVLSDDEPSSAQTATRKDEATE